MRARLSDALGPSFGETTPPSAAARVQPAVRALRVLTPGKWLGIGALFAIGFGVFWIRGPGAPAGHAEPRSAEGTPAVPVAVHEAVSELQPIAAAVEPASEAPGASALQSVAAAVEPSSNKVARTNKRSAQQPPKPAELGLAEELRQLEQIRQLLRVSPARALVEADTHARRFSQGTLGPERELLRVDALLRLGRNAEARNLADRMLAVKAGHPYRAQIEKLLAAP